MRMATISSEEPPPTWSVIDVSFVFLLMLADPTRPSAPTGIHSKVPVGEPVVMQVPVSGAASAPVSAGVLVKQLGTSKVPRPRARIS